MATIVLQAAGAALGSVFGPVGAIVGQALGAMAGAAIDEAVFGTSPGISGRLSSARVPGPDDGTSIPRVYGTARIGGSLIWATRFEESVISERQGGKGGGKRSESYSYTANLAFGLCEGPIAGIGRIYADGRELAQGGIEIRVYNGTKDQLPDPLIEARQGTGKAPAYRGLAYVVFENLPLKSFGNRIPLLQFEVIRPVGALETQIRAITVIPGATEHGYDRRTVSEETGAGQSRILNRNTLSGKSDWSTSIDTLQAVCPNLEAVSLVVAWFGTDLRAGQCQVTPAVEVQSRAGESIAWSVCGTGRAEARLISTHAGGPAFGGTPSDSSVVEAIADLKSRGIKVFLYPFLLMDVPDGNALPDPYGGASQPAYPWRGRITCFPAPGQPGTPDRTALARTETDRFCGSATPADFTVGGTAVRFTGTGGGYLKMILHYALLAKAAGGVDGFIIGSELRGLTTLRDGNGAFPFVEKLVGLAASVRSLLGPQTRLTYGADWSEYFGYQPTDGSGDVRFHLDALWASPAIDAVGIDNYMPLADFRDDDLSARQPDGFRHAEDPDGLERQISAGERFEWYYASDADRVARRRSPITDGLSGKRWVYAPKDLEGWWANRHYDRQGGRELANPTAWLPRMKPIWFTELGCPAIDRGANQPNVFLDPKSTESHAPWFSRRMRSDSAQRRFLEAHHRRWARRDAPAGMVDKARLFVWCWDARPYPAFPEASDIWSDGANWRTGHWLNGRLGSATVADVLAAIMRDHGFSDFDVSGVTGDLPGYIQGDVASARSLIEPILSAFQIDVIEDGARLRFTSRMESSLPANALSVLAEVEDEPAFRETRGKEADFASQAIIGFDDPTFDYESASARSRRMAGGTERVLRLSLPAVLDAGLAGLMAENLLRDLRLSRRSVTFRLSPTELALQAGDVISLPDGPPGRFLVTRIDDEAVRVVEAREFAPGSSAATLLPAAAKVQRQSANAGFSPELAFLDLPRMGDGNSGDFAQVAALLKPWRGISLSSSQSAENYRFRVLLDRPARIGRLTKPLAPTSCRGRVDRGRVLTVALGFGAVSSVTRLEMLSGANRLAVHAANGVEEIIGFTEAEEISPGEFQLKGLLNGLYGTEDAMEAGALQGARVVILDSAVRPIGLGVGELGLQLNYMADGAGNAGAQGPRTPFAGGLRAETPLSPVHLRARRQADGATLFQWTRRGRIDADSWEATDIALDEAVEGWKAELLNTAGDVIASGSPERAEWLYPAAREIADFGARQTRFTLRVRQTGRRVPAGIPATDTISA